MTARFWAALLLPSAVVAFAMWGVGDVNLAFVLYVGAGCILGPWLLLGIRPLSNAGGLPFRAIAMSTTRWIGLVAGLAVLFGPILYVIYSALRPHLGDPAAYLESIRRLGWTEYFYPYFIVLFVGFVPLFEEWWWRGQALPRCVERFGTRRGILISSACFALYHFFVLSRLVDDGVALAVRMLAIFAAGLGWAFLARWVKSWGLGYVAHLAADITMVLVFHNHVKNI